MTRIRWFSLTALLAGLLPPLLFPRVVFQGLSFYYLDLAWLHYPLRAYVADLWRSGTWPLWNPYSWNGFPLLAETEAGALSPVNAVFLLPLATYQSLNLLILLHTMVAGLGAYALARQTGVTQGGALIAALSYACGGYIMAQLVNLNIMIGSAWAPLIFALFLRAMAASSPRYALLAGLTLSLQLYSSQPQVSYYTLILLGVFTLYGALQHGHGHKWHGFLECGAYLAITLFIGLGLSAPQLLTTLELLPQSLRAQGLDPKAQLFLSLPPYGILTLIFPRLFASLTESSLRSTGAFDETHFYLGLIPLGCATLAIFRRRELIVRFAFGMVIVAFLLALGSLTPVYNLLSQLPFEASFRVPARWLFVAAIALIILVGKGADAFDDLMQNASRRAMLKRVIGYLTILVLSPVVITLISLASNSFGTPWANSDDSLLRVASIRLFPEIAAFSIVGGLSLVVVWTLAWRRQIRRAFALAILAITFGDLFLAGGGLATDPSYWEQGRPLADFVKKNSEHDRIFSIGGGRLDVVPRLGYELPTAERIFASSGDEIMALELQRIEDLYAGLPFVKSLQLAGTHWLVIAKHFPIEVNRHVRNQAIIPQLIHVWETDQIDVYAIPNSVPHAYVVYDVIPVPPTGNAIELLNDKGFDVLRMAVVEGTIPSVLQHTNSSLTPATITQYTATSVGTEVDAESDGLFILTDTYYPGWRAWVDGVEQPILRANYLFRGLILPKGHHVIEFHYWPQSFQYGLAIAALTIVLTLIGIMGIGTGVVSYHSLWQK